RSIVRVFVADARGGVSMRGLVLLALSTQLLGVLSCGSSVVVSCSAPQGCNSVSTASGRCECVDWQVTSDQAVPLKFLVVGVVEAAPGDTSQVAVGDYGNFGAGLPADGHSQVGTRMRVVLRDATGKETPLAVDVPPGSRLVALGSTTAALGLSTGFGLGAG